MAIMLATRQGLGAGVGRGEDGVGTGVMLGAGVGRGVAVGRDLGVGLTLPPCALTITQAENSEVLLFGSVAVAVITWPDATITGKVTSIVALQLASVIMSAK